jgi:hypothetical protein
MRLGALVPTLVLGVALVAPALAEADHHRSSEHGHSAYQRSGRGHRYSHHGRYQRGRHEGYRRGHHERRYYRAPRRPYYRPYHRTYRPYYGRRYYYRPVPPVYYAPRPVPYGYYGGPVWAPPPRRGVHGSVSVGLPFLGFSLYF